MTGATDRSDEANENELSNRGPLQLQAEVEEIQEKDRLKSTRNSAVYRVEGDLKTVWVLVLG